jgi:uncharacterized membrane protein
MLNAILHGLQGLPKEWLVFIVAALPISELRGAIPLGLSLGMPLFKAFWLSVLGNASFVAPALFLCEPVSRKLRKLKWFASFFAWIEKRTMKNADTIQKYEAIGLVIFVGIPLPMTGAWSGVIAASLFKIRFRYAFISIMAGILGAGIIVSMLCALGIMSWKAVTQ